MSGNKNNYQQSKFEFNNYLKENNFVEKDNSQNDLLYKLNSDKKYNTLSYEEKSPIKIMPNDFSNLNLVEEYNYLVEQNSTKRNNYFTHDHPKNQINIYEKPYSYNGDYNNSLYLTPKNKTSINSFKTTNDLINNFNEINKNIPLNHSINNNNIKNILNINKTFNKNNNIQRNSNTYKINNSYLNRKNMNKRAFSYTANNKGNMISNPNIIENKIDALYTQQQEYIKMQNNLLSLINNFANFINNNKNLMIIKRAMR